MRRDVKNAEKPVAISNVEEEATDNHNKIRQIITKHDEWLYRTVTDHEAFPNTKENLFDFNNIVTLKGSR